MKRKGNENKPKAPEGLQNTFLLIYLLFLKE